MINKEQGIFAVALAVFALGGLALFTGAPDSADVPLVPGPPPPERGIEDPSVAALFPPAMPPYTRDPFAETDAWAPPRAGRLPDIPEPPVAFAVPRVSIASDGFLGVPSVQNEPPEEKVEAPPEDEEGDGEGDEGVDDEGAGEGAEEDE